MNAWSKSRLRWGVVDRLARPVIHVGTGEEDVVPADAVRPNARADARRDVEHFEVVVVPRLRMPARARESDAVVIRGESFADLRLECSRHSLRMPSPDEIAATRQPRYPPRSAPRTSSLVLSSLLNLLVPSGDTSVNLAICLCSEFFLSVSARNSASLPWNTPREVPARRKQRARAPARSRAVVSGRSRADPAHRRGALRHLVKLLVFIPNVGLRIHI